MGQESIPFTALPHRLSRWFDFVISSQILFFVSPLLRLSPPLAMTCLHDLDKDNALGLAGLARGPGSELLGNGPHVAGAAALELLAADAVPGTEPLAGSASSVASGAVAANGNRSVSRSRVGSDENARRRARQGLNAGGTGGRSAGNRNRGNLRKRGLAQGGKDNRAE